MARTSSFGFAIAGSEERAQTRFQISPVVDPHPEKIALPIRKFRMRAAKTRSGGGDRSPREIHGHLQPTPGPRLAQKLDPLSMNVGRCIVHGSIIAADEKSCTTRLAS